MTKTQFKNMAKDKFLRFQNQKKVYLLRFQNSAFIASKTHEDSVLKELLNADDPIFYENKMLMQIFKKRYNNWVPKSSIEFFKK